MEWNSNSGRTDPRWVDAILGWPWTWLAARVGLTAPFIVGALTKLPDLHSGALEQERVGFHPGLSWALITIAVEITGPILIVSGSYVWSGAGMPSIFTGSPIFSRQ
jgi:uncharacterized membrane protein YphA (DoxX/SURF4 family)